MGGVLGRRSGIRAARSLREVLTGTPAVDHHAHGILRAPPSSLNEFRGLFSESSATGDPLPVQVHTGFGDSDQRLAAARPGLLGPLIERFRDTLFALLHCYPFIREAGWLAHVYGNVSFDLSLTIPHVARLATALREALVLAPASKLLYASDASRTPELYLLAARWSREALGEVLPALFPTEEAVLAARMILRDNARTLYRL